MHCHQLEKRVSQGLALKCLYEKKLQVYEREVKTFKEIGGRWHQPEPSVSSSSSSRSADSDCAVYTDEGEVWFGEDSAEQMVEWLEEHCPTKDAGILDGGFWQSMLSHKSPGQ